MKSVGWIALGMFTYGLAKATAISSSVRGGCPLCEASNAFNAHSLFRSCGAAPLLEEFTYRQNLPPLIGRKGAAVAFGAGHASRILPTGLNALRMVEAGLAGGIAYQAAYDSGGVAGSTLAHAAHNLGTTLGTYLVARDRVRKEGWHRETRQIQPGVTAIACVQSRSAKG